MGEIQLILSKDWLTRSNSRLNCMPVIRSVDVLNGGFQFGSTQCSLQ